MPNLIKSVASQKNATTSTVNFIKSSYKSIVYLIFANLRKIIRKKPETP